MTAPIRVSILNVGPLMFLFSLGAQGCYTGTTISCRETEIGLKIAPYEETVKQMHNCKTDNHKFSLAPLAVDIPSTKKSYANQQFFCCLHCACVKITTVYQLAEDKYIRIANIVNIEAP